MKVLMISKAFVVSAYHAKLRELSRLGVNLTVVVPPNWGGQQLEPVQPEGYELLVTACPSPELITFISTRPSQT